MPRMHIGQGRPDDARLPVRELRHDGRGRGRPRRCDTTDPVRGRHRATRRTSRRWSSASTPREGHTAADREDRGLPHLARRARPRARRPLRTHARPGRPLRPGRTTLAEQRDWYDRLLGGGPTSRCASDDPTTRAIQQAIRFNLFSARPGQRPGRRPRRAGQGRHRLGLRGPLLLGHRGLRRAVPQLHAAPRWPATCMHFRSRMLPAARERARELAQRGALFPWRTINGEEASAYYAAGLRPGAHRRRRRPRPREVRQRDRRRGVPAPRGHRHPRRDRPAVGRPRASGAATASGRSTSTG